MPIINYNEEMVYYAIKSCSYCYDNSIMNKLNYFVHLASFWKIIDELSCNDIYVNLVNYKLNMTCFYEECLKYLESESLQIFDNINILTKISNYITIDTNDPCEQICEPIFDDSYMHDIIYELLDIIVFNDCEFIDDRECLYETVQMLKRINNQIIIEKKF